MAPLYLQSLALLLPCLAAAIASPQPLKLDFNKRTAERTWLTKRDGSVEIALGHNARHVIYQADVSIGTPGQQFTLQVDTGSSDTWVPAATSDQCQSSTGCPNGSFKPADSSTFSQLTQGDGSFNISYDSPGDTDSGYYFNDVLALTKSVSIQNMTVGLATYAFDAQGLIGMGFPTNEASEGTIGQSTPTVLYQLLNNGLINRAAFSLFMNKLSSDSGSIIFGGIDTSKYTGDLVSLPIQPDSQTGRLDAFVVTLSSVSVNDASGTDLLSSADLAVGALLDSGTTGLVLPDPIFTKLLLGMGGTDIGAGFSPVVPCSYANADVNITFGFGGTGGLSVTVPVSQMIGDFYQPEGATFGDGTPQCNFDISSQADDLTGSVILGDSFLRGAYVVYDLENQQIAVAQANLNGGSENIVVIPSGTGLPGVSSTATLAAGTAVAPATGAYTTAVGQQVQTPASPTFSLGSVAQSTGSSSSSSSSSSSNGVGRLGAPVGTTVVGVSVGLGLMTLLGALML